MRALQQNVFGLRMLNRIVHRLLYNAVYANLLLRQQGMPGAKVFESNVQFFRGQRFAQIPQRFLQSKFEQHFGHHIVCYPAQLVYRTFHLIHNLVQFRMIAVILFCGVMRKVDLYPGKRSAQPIVQIAGNPVLFLFFGIQHRLHQLYLLFAANIFNLLPVVQLFLCS
ncbi:hypothetical protein D3C87_1406400 [compost metagenome]